MVAFAISTTLTGTLPPAAPPLLTILVGLIRRFPRPDLVVMAVASVLGTVWALAADSRPDVRMPAPGTPVVLEGWLEVELDGGEVLHTGGRVVPLEHARAAGGGRGERPRSLGGRAVRVRGTVAEPWHPAARPSLRVDEIEPWRSGSVDAPGQPPLGRSWQRFRLAARDRIRDHVRSLYPDRAGLVAALVLADRSALPRDLRERFARAGTAHLLAISGFHVGVLAGWVYLLLGAMRVPRARRPIAASAVVWVYVGVLGFPTSAVRAAVLITAVSIGRLRCRPPHALGAWGAALAFVALVDPTSLHGAGAQLSFAGSLGLILWAGSWGEVLGGPRPRADASGWTRWRRRAGVAVAASAAAQVATLALVAWHFQRVPLAGLPASVLATPLVAFALPGIVLSLIARTLPFVPGGVAGSVAAGADGLLLVTTTVVDALGHAGGVVHVGPVLLIGPTVGAFIGGALAGSPTSHPRRLSDTWRVRARIRRGRWARGAMVGAWLGIGALPALDRTVSRPLEIHVLDVGQGDAMAIRSPRGRWTLVDAGPDGGENLLRALARLGVRRIEMLVVTHPDLDHVGGAAPLVRAMEVRRIVGSGLLRGTEALEALAVAAVERGAVWTVVSPGDRWEQDGVLFDVLHAGEPPAEPNDQSVVLRVAHGAFEALLTGDVSSSIEDRIAAGMPAPVDDRLEVLKVAHHGSRTSSSGRALDDLGPAVAVISVGRRNRFGHPAPSVLRRFVERAIPVVRTDRDGSIRIRARVDGSFEITSEFGADAVFAPHPSRRSAGEGTAHD